MFSWTSLLFVLCSSLTPVFCCDWLTQYAHLSRTSLKHIRLMGGQLTDQESPVPFPEKLYSRIRNETVESQLVFIRDSLELISDLYHHDNLSSATWDSVETEHFLTVIDRQIDGLNTCVSTNSTTDSRLRKYYRRLETCTVYRTGGSTASWELIRKETKLHLERLYLLVASIRRSSSATQQQL
ncbi:interferon a3-like [Sparus aurata]|uniref:Interferon a3-like n=1 Tax=Sparus aurata TaxID=8175 RepID=A0A671WHA6_SPAAU|nr:interferon a3-like [Sparus aurata]